MCHVSSNQLDKANQSKGRQVKSCMNCPDRNNNVDLLPLQRHKLSRLNNPG